MRQEEGYRVMELQEDECSCSLSAVILVDEKVNIALWQKSFRYFPKTTISVFITYCRT